MNQQIKTGLGVIIILIFAAMAGMFVWQTQKNQPEIAQPQLVKIEKKAMNGTTDWQTYRNEKYGFEFKYPKDWLANGYNATREDGSTMYSIGIGDIASIPGGMRWGVNIYNSSGDADALIEKIIARLGSQFDDRREKRENIVVGEEQAIKVTITTNHYDDWISEEIIFERNDTLFTISNGAVKDDLFDSFISTFKFIN